MELSNGRLVVVSTLKSCVIGLGCVAIVVSVVVGVVCDVTEIVVSADDDVISGVTDTVSAIGVADAETLFDTERVVAVDVGVVVFNTSGRVVLGVLVGRLGLRVIGPLKITTRLVVFSTPTSVSGGGRVELRNGLNGELTPGTHMLCIACLTCERT